jgi:VWFA-related protein
MRNRATIAVRIAVTIAAVTPVLVAAQATQRSMYVAVVDKSGVPVADLGPADFIVREDKVTREVLSVEPAREPMQIALLVDNSQASEPFIRDYREAIPAFVAEMLAPDGPRHMMSLIALAERPTIFTEYTTDRALLQKGVNRLFAMSGSATYLLDGIMEVSQGIAKRQSARPIIVALTTEGPELSERQYQQVLEELKEGGATLHIVTIGRPVNQDHDRSVVLDRGTKETGGRFDTVLMSTALTAKVKEVARELKSQYRVTYARPRTLIPPERITVDAAKPGLTARGIVAPLDREGQP